jgi:gamma-glutamyl-gamma-aminobutyrate hydrolase PuuD
VLNIALGGDLEQHVPDRTGAETHKETPGVFADHDVSIDSGTKLGEILGDRHDVKSHHHQGFGRIGDGLNVTAHAPDGTVEGLEDPTRRFTLGVLWHPEEGEDLALFEALVAEASR